MSAGEKLAGASPLRGERFVYGLCDSPLGKDQNILLIADTSLQRGNNFVAGANRIDYHKTWLFVAAPPGLSAGPPSP